MSTFHNDIHGEYRAGDVICMGDGAFMHVVILGFDGQGNARVSRPYAYASGVGTTGPTVLLGAETYEVPIKHFADRARMSEGRRT